MGPHRREARTLVLTRIGIVADDLTSATDATGPFANPDSGLSPTVSLCGWIPGDANVAAVDADSRAHPSNEATGRVERAFGSLGPTDVVIKTVDSTVRGHLVTEIASAMAITGHKLVVVAPAFPAEGRTTQGGVQLLNGVPVHETHFGSDPTHPLATSSLLELLAPLHASAVGKHQLWTSMPPRGVVIVDAANQSDLDDLVKNAPLEDVLWVGSPGLCRALAARLHPVSAQPLPPSLQPGPVLFVVGTLHPATTAQLEELEGSGVAVTHPNTLHEHSRGGDVAVCTPRISREPNAVQALAQAVAPLIQSGHYRRVVLTGGATARTVLEECRIDALHVLGELEPGTTVVRSGDEGPDIVLKAGGFGSPNFLSTMTSTNQRTTRS